MGQYALAPELAKLLPLFQSAAICGAAERGTLVQRTKAQYLARSVSLPEAAVAQRPTELLQAHRPRARLRLGGRIGDLLQSATARRHHLINVTGNAAFLTDRRRAVFGHAGRTHRAQCAQQPAGIDGSGQPASLIVARHA